MVTYFSFFFLKKNSKSTSKTVIIFDIHISYFAKCNDESTLILKLNIGMLKIVISVEKSTFFHKQFVNKIIIN